jgi:hypothetical protein
LTTKTRLRDCWIFNCRALVFGTKPDSRIIWSTFSFVSGRTSGRSLMTREMVLTEQPLRRAMSLMVMFGIPGSTSLSVEVLVFTEIVRERCRERFQ